MPFAVSRPSLPTRSALQGAERPNLIDQLICHQVDGHEEFAALLR